MVELLREFNIAPDAVIGHSSGEIAAAYTIGALSLESAVRVAYHRGRLAQRLVSQESTPGAMISVNIGEADVDTYLNGLCLSGAISVACVNSPINVTLSGDEVAIDALQIHLRGDNIFARKLVTGVAYHSPAMAKIAEEYRACISSLKPRESQNVNITMISSVTGLTASASSLSQAEYWVENLVSPVRFTDALRYLAIAAPQIDGLKNSSTYVEVGPHAALKRSISDTLSDANKGQGLKYYSVLSKYEPPIKSVLEVVGQLFSTGYNVSVTRANQHQSEVREWPFLVNTPAYPFDHSQLHWHETRLSRNWRLREAAPESILGVRATDWNPLEPRWRKMLRTSTMPWLEDHVIGGNVLFPAAGMVNMALEAVRQMADSSQVITGYRIKEASFMKPIIIRSEDDNEVITQLRPLKQTYEKAVLRFEVTIYMVANDYWTECSKFSVRLEYEEHTNEVDDSNEARMAAEMVTNQYCQTLQTSTTMINKERFYKWGRDQGLNWTNLFALAEDIRWDGGKLATSVVNVESLLEPYQGIVHPAILDSAFQVVYVPASRGASREIPAIIPYKFRNVWISAKGWQHPHTHRIHALGKSEIKPNDLGIECTIDLLSDCQVPLGHIEAIMLPVMGHKAGDTKSHKALLHRVDWKPTLSMLSVDQLRQYCNNAYPTPDEASAVKLVRKLECYLKAVMRENLRQLVQCDWRKTPLHMKDYVLFMQTHSRDLGEIPSNVINIGDLEAELETLSTGSRSTKLFVEVAKNLVPIVRGDVAASDFLLSSTLVQDYYEELLGRFHDPRLISFLDLAAHQNPSLKIIEVGAGQGAMTNLVLSVLDQLEERGGGNLLDEYIYADSSDLNIEKARERFKSHQHRITYKKFDLKLEAPAQAFQSAGFDLVLVGGGLHSTHDLPSALQGLRSLLKPGGHIVFCDATVPGCFPLNFGFGVLPDWWSNKGESLVARQILNESEWDAVLQQNNFTGTDLIIWDYQHPDAHYASIIVSTASPLSHSLQGVVRPEITPKVILIVPEGQDEQAVPTVSQFEEAINQLKYAVHVVPIKQLQDLELGSTDSVVFLADLSGTLLADMSSQTFELIKRLIAKTAQIVWVTSGSTDEQARAGMQNGFLRTLRSEFDNKRIVSVAVNSTGTDSPSNASQIFQVLRSAFNDVSPEVEYIIREGQVLTGRLVEDTNLNHRLSASIRPETRMSSWIPGPPLKLHVGIRGRLDTLHFREDTVSYEALGPKDVEIEAKAWAVNFRDVFSALGRLDEPGFGFDCAGIVTRVGSDCTLVQPGDRVCMCLWDCMRMFPRSLEQAVVKLHSSVSFEEACAIIVPGMTAWHSLMELARLSKGEKILIHAAAGATGQLAIQIAQMVGAEIFATVGYIDKKEFLIETYGIPEDHIFHSRSTHATFAKGIMRMTKGYGVDVVLNSLMGEGLRASWECIAPYGRFIEIGKADINDDASLPMLTFAKNATFSAVDIRHMIVNRHQMASELLNQVMRLASEGTIHCPKPLRMFDVDAVEDAFRYIQGGKNTGRAIIRIDPSTKVQVRDRTPYSPIAALVKISCAFIDSE